MPSVDGTPLGLVSPHLVEEELQVVFGLDGIGHPYCHSHVPSPRVITRVREAIPHVAALLLADSQILLQRLNAVTLIPQVYPHVQVTVECTEGHLGVVAKRVVHAHRDVLKRLIRKAVAHLLGVAPHSTRLPQALNVEAKTLTRLGERLLGKVHHRCHILVLPRPHRISSKLVPRHLLQRIVAFDDKHIITLPPHDQELVCDVLRIFPLRELLEKPLEACGVPVGLAWVAGGRDDCDVDAHLHDCAECVDDPRVLVKVHAVLVDGVVGVEGQHFNAALHLVDLRDVEDLPHLGEGGGDESPFLDCDTLREIV
mmetsp:Transcript_30485/g.59551  ORF Transcript_30485/g.59551 Transcript_30485/m.59551 type:complete len:312 (-) Transcript_30485:266-1201(-)